MREAGHDVRAADAERELDGMTDEDLLTLATTEARIMMTFNVADFPDIVRRWAEDGRTHSGCAIVVGIDHSEFGTIIRLISKMLANRPDPQRWHDYPCFVARGHE